MSNVRTIMSQAAAAGTPLPTAWDADYLYYNDPGAWDISTGVSIASISVASQSSFATDIFFKPDGTVMYLLDQAVDRINQYNLSTAWNVSTATYSQTFGVSTQDTDPSGLHFKPDGTKMYICGRSSDAVHEFDLSTAWDITTATFNQNFSIVSEEAAVLGLRFKPDGSRMYIVGSSGDEINEYSLSTPWDISTASFVQLFDISAQFTLPLGLDFKPDGTKMYVVGTTANVTEYSLGIPWDVSTASSPLNLSITGNNTVRGIFFKPDGGNFYYVDSDLDTVYQYSLGGFSVTSQEATPRKVFFKPDGTRMYVMGETGDDINQYNLSTPWDTSTAIYAAVGSVSGQEANPQGMYFKSDGTTLYVIGITGDDVNQYNLTVPWTVSSLAYVKNSSVSAQDIDPQDIFFKPDGTKMFVLGNGGNAVYEYSLSTAWDVATKTYVQNFSVSAQDTTPTTFSFKPDGTKMFIHGFNSKFIYEYNLSTPWDLASASYSTKSYSSNIHEAAPWGIFIREEGTQLFLVGTTNDKVYTYSFGVPY